QLRPAEEAERPPPDGGPSPPPYSSALPRRNRHGWRDADDSRRPCPADRLRQRRRPAAVAGNRTRPGDRRPPGARRPPLADRAADADRKPPPWLCWGAAP